MMRACLAAQEEWASTPEYKLPTVQNMLGGWFAWGKRESNKGQIAAVNGL
jgi:hypothetical protein